MSQLPEGNFIEDFYMVVMMNAITCVFQGYRSCAQRASILFFVLNDMGRIDLMYQFSLDSYIELFNISIDKSQRSAKLEERIANLNEYHTYAVYRWDVLKYHIFTYITNLINAGPCLPPFQVRFLCWRLFFVLQNKP